MTLGVFTWNIGGIDPPEDVSQIAGLISSDLQSDSVPDLFVVGLQETIELSTVNILKGHDEKVVEKYKRLF